MSTPIKNPACHTCGSANTDRGPSGTVWCLSCDAMVKGPDKTTAPAPSRYEVHPAADVFPMMSEAEFLLLKADIEANGQHESIVFWNEKLLDGRNRLRACTELGMEPDTCELDDDDDPFAYVISANIHRRHLEVGQRSLIAAKLASMKRGDAKSQRDDRQNCLSQTEAAELLNVSPRSVKSAKAVLDSGSQSVIEAIEQRDLSVSLAEKLCKSVPDQKKQAKIVRDGKDAIKAATAEPKSKPTKKPQPTTQSLPVRNADAIARVNFVRETAIAIFTKALNGCLPEIPGGDWGDAMSERDLVDAAEQKVAQCLMALCGDIFRLERFDDIGIYQYMLTRTLIDLLPRELRYKQVRELEEEYRPGSDGVHPAERFHEDQRCYPDMSPQQLSDSFFGEDTIAIIEGYPAEFGKPAEFLLGEDYWAVRSMLGRLTDGTLRDAAAHIVANKMAPDDAKGYIRAIMNPPMTADEEPRRPELAMTWAVGMK